MHAGRAIRTAALGLALALAALPAAAAVQTAAPAGAPAAIDQLPPAPTRWVTDEVGFLSPAARDRLDQRLEAFERSSGHQVVVWIGGTLGPQSLEDWAARTFEAWGVGRKGKDDGAAIFLFAQDRKVRIEVGYGLEDRLTDLRASRIIREELAPRLQRGDRDGALSATVDRMLGGDRRRRRRRRPATAGGGRAARATVARWSCSGCWRWCS